LARALLGWFPKPVPLARALSAMINGFDIELDQIKCFFELLDPGLTLD
jgi:hypothetical protein